MPSSSRKSVQIPVFPPFQGFRERNLHLFKVLWGIKLYCHSYAESKAVEFGNEIGRAERKFLIFGTQIAQHKMKSHKAVFLLPIAAAGLTACGDKAPKQPNIIFIMTDDHTTQAISCYGGNLVQTPNIDRIANEGMRMDNVYATNALSGPSRACILTGKLGHVNGFMTNDDTFDGDQQTLPKLLQTTGYQTAIIGKWHLISEPQGFDYWSILAGRYQGQQGLYYRPTFWENGEMIEEEGYVTDVITDKVIKYLDGRDKSRPFFVMMHEKAPHRNWMPAPRHLGIFNDTVFPEPDNLFDDYSTRTSAAHEQDMSIEKTLQDEWDLKLSTREEILGNPHNRLHNVYSRMPEDVMDKWDSVYAGRIAEFRSGKLKGDELVRWKYQQYLRDYLATTLAVDENIGRLLDYLEEIGELDNTIIVYTSDQGFFLGEHGWFDKRFMYEECERMPFVVRYPKAIKAGSTSSALCMNIDFAPTFLDFAGVEIPEDIQGESFRVVLENGGETPSDWRKAVYYHYYEYPAEHSVKKHRGVRTQDYKLLEFYEENEWELYDMAADPHEMNNVYDDPTYAAVRDSLVTLLAATREVYGDTE